MSIFAQLQRLGAVVENCQYRKSDKDSGQSISQKLDHSSWEIMTNDEALAIAVQTASEPAKVTGKQGGKQVSGSVQSTFVAQLIAEDAGLIGLQLGLRDQLQTSVLRARLVEACRAEKQKQIAIQESLMEQAASIQEEVASE
jgi:hypothetical protein